MSISDHFEDPTNKQILAVSEDQLQGFHPDPIGEIAERTGLSVDLICQRIRAMLQGGAIRRVRQTFLTTSLAEGALVAWKVPPAKLTAAFDYLFEQDPFSGHVVQRTTDGDSPGSKYRLWTTLKLPPGYSVEKHCEHQAKIIGAQAFKILKAKKLFALGVGHVRRRDLAPGERTDVPAKVQDVKVIQLTALQWRVLEVMKREFTPEEIQPNLWQARADQLEMSLESFLAIGQQLQELQIVGRFSTFLEHVKRHKNGSRVTRYNALFHWRVPKGQEMAAGIEVGRHLCMTHAYWREGGEEFSHVNIMGVSHGMDKDTVLANKAAMDAHLEEAGIPVLYTNVFWGGRSEIKPSEFTPAAYQLWCKSQGLEQIQKASSQNE